MEITIKPPDLKPGDVLPGDFVVRRISGADFRNRMFVWGWSPRSLKDKRELRIIDDVTVNRTEAEYPKGSTS